MAKVSIHAPKTPATAESNEVATNTLPNVCKTPGAPFTPAPLPNVGRSEQGPWWNGAGELIALAG